MCGVVSLRPPSPPPDCRREDVTGRGTLFELRCWCGDMGVMSGLVASSMAFVLRGAGGGNRLLEGAALTTSTTLVWLFVSMEATADSGGAVLDILRLPRLSPGGGR